MSGTLPEKSAYYALDALSNQKHSILKLLEMMETNRRAIDKYMAGNYVRAEDCYIILQKAQIGRASCRERV